MSEFQLGNFTELKFLDAIPDAAGVIDADGTLRQVNTLLEQMFGYSASELLGQNIEILTADLTSAETLPKVTESNRPFVLASLGLGENRCGRRKDGSNLLVDVVASPLETVPPLAGDYYLAVIRDVSARNRIQEELRDTLEDYHSILDGVADLIQSVNPDGSIAFVNRSWLDTLGYSLEETLTLSIFQIIATDQHAHCHLILERLLAGEHVGMVESRFVRKNGTVIDVEGRITLRHDRSGNTTTTGLFRDITERKAAESRLKEFYSIVSHELRAPLTSINGSVKLIESGVMGTVPEEIAGLITVASQETDRLLHLINDMLDLRKIEIGKMELHFQDFRIEDLVTAVLELMQGMASQSSVKLESSVEEKLSLCADYDRIFQALVNLVSNAIKFSPVKGVVLVRVELANSKRVKFSVIDHGPGIAQESIPKLFGKFQQLEAADHSNFPGTGLGLAISKAIVEEHGGSIGVDSVQDAGTIFWFDLPLNSTN